MILLLSLFILYLICIIITNIFFEDTNLISIFISIVFLIISAIIYLVFLVKNINKSKSDQIQQ